MKKRLLEIAMRYVDNSKEANDMVSELMVLFSENIFTEKELRLAWNYEPKNNSTWQKFLNELILKKSNATIILVDDFTDDNLQKSLWNIEQKQRQLADIAIKQHITELAELIKVIASWNYRE